MTNRLTYIDRLRILATILVVLHHTAIIYGGSGDWLYKEQSDSISSILLTLFTAVNQSFFMGLFFFFAGYFSVNSLRNKQPLRFLRDRFLRLGIPLLATVLFGSPAFMYIYKKQTGSMNGNSSFWQYMSECWQTGSNLGSGPMWFVKALLIFSLVLALFYKIRPAFFRPDTTVIPSAKKIVGVLLGAGILTFLVKIIFPIGSRIFEFQPAHFVQYILLFSTGLLTAKGNWLDAVPEKTFRYFKWIAFAGLTALPVMLVISLSQTKELLPFLGGLTWQSAAHAVWEQITGASIIISLIGFFQNRGSEPGLLHRFMARNAYTVYIIHGFVVNELGLAFSTWQAFPLLKFAVTGFSAVCCVFIIAYPIRSLPGLRKIL